jgi:tetratricopeptide (TPR) repeat protein
MEPQNEKTSAEVESDYHATVGDMRGEDGDFVGALGEYKKAAQLNATPQRLMKLADGYAAVDLPQKAFDLYQRALRAQEESGADLGDLTEAHIGMGDIACTFARSAAAVRSYERAVRSQPKKPFYRWKLAVTLATMGLYDKAAAQLETALELSPGDAFYHFQLADVYLLMRRFDDAIKQFESAVLQAPRDDYYCLRLGAAFLRLERTQEAVPHFERAVELKPENASYRTLLRYAYARNQQEPAISVDVEMLELGPYDEDFVKRIQRMAQPLAA